MLRYLDISDTYLGHGGRHPSDVISALVAAGESVGADGASVINAIVLAYYVYCSLNDAVDIGAKGWDQTLYAVLGSVVVAARLMRLSREQMGSDPACWGPTTRESADHSMPYVMAIALLDGEMTLRSFAPDRLSDPAVANLMRKVKVSESAAMTAQYPEAAPDRVSIRMSSGEVIAQEIKYPQGHARNPMDDAAVDEKFREMFRAHADKSQCDKVLQSV